MKKVIYIILATFLGIILGGIAVVLVEKFTIDNSISQGIVPVGYFYVREYGYIPPYLAFGIIIFGAIAGFLIGRKWWRIVYVEKRKRW